MNERALIALLILVALVVLSNLIMVGIVRSLSRGDSNWLGSLRSALSRPLEASHKPVDDLHRQIEELAAARRQSSDQEKENDESRV